MNFNSIILNFFIKMIGSEQYTKNGEVINRRSEHPHTRTKSETEVAIRILAWDQQQQL